MTEREAVERMLEIVRILRGSVAQGLAGTEYPDRILGHQSGELVRELEAAVSVASSHSRLGKNGVPV